MPFKVEVVGLNELVRDVAKAGGNAKPLVRAAITNATSKIQSNVRKRAKHRTGTLQRSVITTVRDVYGIVEVAEKYGEWIENGTGIYGPTGQRIVPKSAKALAFTYMGKKVFARSVKGMKAAPFFKPGVDESESYVNQQFDKVAEKLVNVMAGKS